MGARSGGGGGAGMGIQSRMNVIDNAKQMSTSELLKMSEEGGLGGLLATKELTSRITIEKPGNLVFRNPNGKAEAFKGGFAMKLGDEGFVGFSDGVYVTTKKNLTKILDAGGLTHYKASQVFKPIGTYDKGRLVLNK